jgi:hypothetical protein
MDIHAGITLDRYIAIDDGLSKPDSAPDIQHIALAKIL